MRSINPSEGVDFNEEDGVTSWENRGSGENNIIHIYILCIVVVYRGNGGGGSSSSIVSIVKYIQFF